MRVIAGSARRTTLIAPDDRVRPTTDRTKETLFNMIQSYIPNGKILDLFAGSGALGIEALSRGAAYGYFSDTYKKSIECIKKNLERTKLIEKAKVFMYDYKKTLSLCKDENLKFDIIFLDPPYDKGLESEALKMIATYDLLEDDGIIVVESDIKTTLDMSLFDGLEIYRLKEYKTNKFTFIQKEVEE